MDTATHYTNYADTFTDMRGHTTINTPFKLVFKKVDGTVKIIPKALLRKQTPTAKDKNGAYKINYIDTATDALGSCYIPLILSVNDKQIKLK